MMGSGWCLVWYVMVARVCMVCRAQVLPVDLFGVGLCLPGFRCPGRSRVWRCCFIIYYTGKSSITRRSKLQSHSTHVRRSVHTPQLPNVPYSHTPLTDTHTHSHTHSLSLARPSTYSPPAPPPSTRSPPRGVMEHVSGLVHVEPAGVEVPHTAAAWHRCLL